MQATETTTLDRLSLTMLGDAAQIVSISESNNNRLVLQHRNAYNFIIVPRLRRICQALS